VLTVLQKIEGHPFSLAAIHVHHGLSPHADAWADFCLACCEALQVPIEVVHVQLGALRGRGVERAAREARYAAFEQAPGDVLCLGHHQNDRAETLLLNLFRGAGIKGLAGVPASRTIGEKQLVRPLIELPRETLRTWAVAHDLTWINDESNEALRYRRNFLRHKVLPVVTEVFPGAMSVLARTASQMSVYSALFDRLAEIDATGCVDPEGFLLASKLSLLPEPALANVVRYRLNQAGVSLPSTRRLQALCQQLKGVDQTSEIHVRLGHVGCYVWRDFLWLDWQLKNRLPNGCPLTTGAFEYPDGRLEIQGLTKSLPDQSVRLGVLGSGNRFQPQGRCRDSVSEMLRARGIPPWVRPRLPALWQDERLLWVPELGWSAEATYASDLRLNWHPVALRRL
jgi:tRNA(Ile)-lysidine synthase